MNCKRCGGSGYLPQYDYIQDGICFRCRGTGKELAIPLTPVVWNVNGQIGTKELHDSKLDKWVERFNELKLKRGKSAYLVIEYDNAVEVFGRKAKLYHHTMVDTPVAA
jgi:hypothetical protein